jgi:hypothetical protein
MSSSDSQLNVTPEAVRLVTEELNSEFLPEKSKGRYIGQFNNFKQWYGTKLIKKYIVVFNDIRAVNMIVCWHYLPFSNFEFPNLTIYLDAVN